MLQHEHWVGAVLNTHTATCCWVSKPVMHTVLFAESSQTSFWMTALKETGANLPYLNSVPDTV